MGRIQRFMSAEEKKINGTVADQLGIAKNGLSAAVLMLQQTALNIPQEEINATTERLRSCVDGILALSLTKIDELNRDPKARAWLGLKDISVALANFLQLRQGLAGYTTKTAQMDYRDLMGTLDELKETRAPIEARIEALTRLVEEKRKALPGPAIVVKAKVVREKAAKEKKAEPEGSNWEKEGQNVMEIAARKWLVERMIVDNQGRRMKINRKMKIPEWVRGELEKAAK